MRWGTIVLIGWMIVAAAIVGWVLWAPSQALRSIDRLDIRVFLIVTSLIVSGYLAVTIFRFFYLPTARRMVRTLIGAIVPPQFLLGLGTLVIDRLSFRLSIDPQKQPQLNVEFGLNGGGQSWVPLAMVIAAIVAAIILARLYADLEREEQSGRA